jgi:LmbE family N-acetylglucosaminyl deacetylase
MSVAFDHRDGGTDEASWAAAAPWSDAPELSLDFDRVVVASAHPDDETLGASGLIAMAGAAGIPVSLIVMTDGEGSHPHDTRIAARRRCESINAANQLGPAIPIRFVGLPDGGLRERRAAVRSALIGALSESPALRTLLVVPWWGDGHRDHRIVGEVGRQLAASGVHVVGYPIWMWHWAQADSVDTTSWRTLPLDEHARARKRAAIDEHRSQIEPAGAEPPILHDGMRRHFERHVEIFIDAGPLTDSPSQYDTEWFEAFYARHDDPWGLESRWLCDGDAHFRPR